MRWEDLISTALLGTERQPLALSPTSGAVAQMVARLQGRSPERVLLAAAGSLALWEQAGMVPEEADPTLQLAPCAPESQPRCSERAAHHLSLILNGPHRALLAEWLAALGRVGQRVPEEHLPALLALGRDDEGWRAALRPVVGERGLWLGMHAPMLNYITVSETPTEEEVNELWQTGNSQVRRGLLMRLRQQNPAQARALLAATWGKEASEDRALFLGAFDQGLGPEDEVFLEQALDDRRKEVRQTAAALLAALPGSVLGQRQAARLDAVLTLVRATGKQPATIQVMLPDECDKGMIRDGVNATLRLTDIGEKAGWVLQMVGAAPLAHWSARWQAAPDEIVQAATQSEWAKALLQGLALAAKRQQAVPWASALLRAWPDRQSDFDGPSLMGVFSQAQSEGMIFSFLTRVEGPLNDAHPALPLLEASQQPWSATLSRAMLARIRQSIVGRGAVYRLRRALAHCARQVDPAMWLEAQAEMGAALEKNRGWQTEVDEFLSILQFRHEMLKEINR